MRCTNHKFDEFTNIHIFCNILQQKLLFDATTCGSLIWRWNCYHISHDGLRHVSGHSMNIKNGVFTVKNIKEISTANHLNIMFTFDLDIFHNWLPLSKPLIKIGGLAIFQITKVVSYMTTIMI